MKRFTDLINDVLPNIKEIFPWDLEQKLTDNSELLLVDIREPYEFDVMHIQRSINVPRGVLETACDWGYDETIPEIAGSRDREIVVICRSGNRSALAANTMQLMGFQNVCSLKTGLVGWNDYELPLVDSKEQAVTLEEGDAFFEPKVRPDQMPPNEG